MTQPDLFSHRFNGDDYIPARDDERLSKQHERVKAVMLDGRWYTLQAIADATGDPPASVSAQLRHLRKERFGGYIINKRYVDNGLYQYQLLEPVA